MILLSLATLIQAAIGDVEIAGARSEAAEIRAAFDREMIDYPSARFRDVHVTVNLEVAPPRGGYFCGYVNGKNRLGAYSGWKQFVASGTPDGKGLVIVRDDIAATDELVDIMCGDNSASDPTDRSAWLTFR